ncbi:MAG: hypothetical protein FJ010_09005 [Chloroflexi bacterium]|nr:hypothetical protein [Chloroflexota bacterium]
MDSDTGESVAVGVSVNDGCGDNTEDDRGSDVAVAEAAGVNDDTMTRRSVPGEPWLDVELLPQPISVLEMMPHRIAQ